MTKSTTSPASDPLPEMMMQPVLTNPFLEPYAGLIDRHSLALNRQRLQRLHDWFRLDYLMAFIGVVIFACSVESDLSASYPTYSTISGSVFSLAYICCYMYLRSRLKREETSLLQWVTIEEVVRLIARQLRDFHRRSDAAAVLAEHPETECWLVDKPTEYALQLLDDDPLIRLKGLRCILDAHGPGFSLDIAHVNQLVAMRIRSQADKEIHNQALHRLQTL